MEWNGKRKKNSRIGLIRSAKASLIAQLVKNPPAMQETLVRFLDWEDPLVHASGEGEHVIVPEPW